MKMSRIAGIIDLDQSHWSGTMNNIPAGIFKAVQENTMKPMLFLCTTRHCCIVQAIEPYPNEMEQAGMPSRVPHPHRNKP